MQGIPAKTAVAASAAVAAGAGSYVLYQNRQSISLALWRWQLKRCVDGTTQRIQVVNDMTSWNAIEKELLRSSYALGCVGFDCEWVTGSGTRRPVALLQLATHSGLCVLVRLCRLTSPPQKLRELLQDPVLLKVGVAPTEDCRLLQMDHGIVVNGALDLRSFFSKLPSETKQTKKMKKKKKDINKTEDELDSKTNIEDENLENTSRSSGTVENKEENSDANSTRKDAARIKENCSEVPSIISTQSMTCSPLEESLFINNTAASTLSVLCSDPVTSSKSSVTKASLLSSTKASSEEPLSPALKSAGHKVTFVGLKGPAKLGLSGLAHFYLQRTLDKDWRVRASDWEAEFLTQRQIRYAAEDARSGLHVFLIIIQTIVVSHNLFQQCSVGFLASVCSWSSTTKSLISCVASQLKLCSPPGGWHSENSKKYSKCVNTENNQQQQKNKGYRRAYSLRKSPLYHNSVLWAPDNEPLCTVDPKKAYWYVDNGLGEVVQEDPLIVRLNFEPTGRPQKEGADGYFYLNERQNVCVVCGKGESYIRKNVVPHEYRKYFPEILKSHQNHDVVLLCTECHQLSNQLDGVLRYQLAEKHNAPIGNCTDVKVVIDGNLKVIKSAGKALSKKDSKIPPGRIAELRKILEDFFETNSLTDELITKASELDVSIVNDSYEPHGLRVFKHYEKIGLIHFEKLWRENFLKTMNPQFMPKGWSVTHNHEKLKLKMSRYPLDDPVREQYRIALVGTSGSIDVPYLPQKRRPNKLQHESSNDVSPSNE
ncbi:3'-5' exonuclease domain [Trinorchestia longiramus]|nr:3'-5' exonuclease domain [Trinorchestia longiramus]